MNRCDKSCRHGKEIGFSTYLKNLPRIRYLFPKNRVTLMFIIAKVPLWIYTVYYTYDTFCVKKIKHIMYNVQDYSVLYNNAVHLVICFV
jgi:hypothetical protein